MIKAQRNLDGLGTTGGRPLPVGTTAQRIAVEGLVRINSDTGLLEWYQSGSWHTAGGAGTVKKSLYFSLDGTATATTGLLTKASDAGLTANPSGKPTTNIFDPGINNAGSDPYMMVAASTITSVRVVFAGGGVSTGTVTSPFIRIRIYQVNYSTRTQLGSDIDISVSNAGPPTIGTFDNTANDGFQTAVSGALSIAVSAGALIGVEFSNGTGDSQLSAVRNLFVTLQIQE